MARWTTLRVAGIWLAIALAGSAGAAEPADEEEAPSADAAQRYPRIGGDANLSGQRTAGNTESTSLELGASAQIEYATWRHSAELTAFRAEEDDEEIADRYRLAGQSDYKFSERAYLFVRGSFERQRFGAFDRRFSASLGVGRRFIETDRVTLDLAAGAGRRSTEPVDSDRTDAETIARLGADFAWRFAESGQLTQSLEVEPGDTNTYSRSVTALKSRLTGALAWRVAHTVEHNSEVPAGTEETDTFTSVGLTYSF